jgi:3-oxoacyl-[acyl-carrier protein] reductase
MITAPDRPVALVTGASSGIGAEVAHRLAGTCCNVAVNYRSNSEGAAEVAAKCFSRGADAVALIGDFADDADCRALVDATLERWGRLDFLINNAGITRFAPADDLDALSGEDFAQIFAVNVTGAYQMARAAEKALRSARGAIVNVSSNSAFSGMGSSSAYAASKGALNTLTLALARALAPDVRVNAVCPGFVDTNWMSPKFSPDELTAFKARVARSAPLRILVGPPDVAEAIIWLALKGRAVTGQLLVIDAGANLNVGNLL